MGLRHEHIEMRPLAVPQTDGLAQELTRLGRWQRPARGENPLPAGVSIRTDPGSQELLTEQSREQAAPSQQACPCLLLAGKVLRPACKREAGEKRPARSHLKVKEGS